MATYRVGEQQRAQLRRYLMRSAGGLGVVQLGIGAAFGRLGHALALLGVAAAVVVFFSVAARFSFTELNDEGIRTRAYAFRVDPVPGRKSPISASGGTGRALPFELEGSTVPGLPWVLR